MSSEPIIKDEELLLDKKVNENKNENLDIKSEKSKNEELKERKKLIAIYFLSGLIVLSIIIFIIVFDFFPDYAKGIFECTYISNGKEIEILNHNYNNENLEIFINDKEFNEKNPKYKAHDDFKVIIKIINEEIDMKNMFAFTNIKEVKMKSDKNVRIKNMENSFENCYSLEKFEIEGFNTSIVTNMSKLFYNSTNLTKVNIQNISTFNLEDMSYMFAYTNISTISIPNFPIITLLNSTGVFEGCNSTVIIKRDTNNEILIEELETKYPNLIFKYEN